jgi:hypothetical protein
MNILLWVLQVALALLWLSGGACKAFKFDELAKQMSPLPRGGWRASGVVEMLGAALGLETLGLAALYARSSVKLTVANPLACAVAMGLLVAFVACGRYERRPLS